MSDVKDIHEAEFILLCTIALTRSYSGSSIWVASLRHGGLQQGSRLRVQLRNPRFSTIDQGRLSRTINSISFCVCFFHLVLVFSHSLVCLKTLSSLQAAETLFLYFAGLSFLLGPDSFSVAFRFRALSSLLRLSSASHSLGCFVCRWWLSVLVPQLEISFPLDRPLSWAFSPGGGRCCSGHTSRRGERW